MKNFFYIFIFLFMLFESAYSQSLNLRLSSFFYSWERADSVDMSSSTTHFKGYQNLLLEVSEKKWSLNTLMQSEEDIVNKSGEGFKYRIYNLYLKGSNLYDLFDLKIGRQYVFAGAGNTAIDGINLKFKAGKSKEFQFTGFAGALTPMDYEFKKYPSLNNNFTVGALFSYYGIRGMNASVSYFKKNKKTDPYQTLRLDSLFVTREIEIETDSRQDQLTGLDLSYSGQKDLTSFLKLYYDLNTNKLYRFEANTGYKINQIRLSASYTYRQPYIRYNSIFWIFPQNENQEIEFGIDYSLKNGINIFGKVSDVIYSDDNSFRIQMGFNHPGFGLTYTKYAGYAGESDGANAYYYAELIRAVLSGSIALNYYNYKLGEYSDNRSSAFSGMLGFTYRPVSQFSIDVQGQFITNKINDYDTRVLFGFSYWLFDNF